MAIVQWPRWSSLLKHRFRVGEVNPGLGGCRGSGSSRAGANYRLVSLGTLVALSLSVLSIKLAQSCLHLKQDLLCVGPGQWVASGGLFLTAQNELPALDQPDPWELTLAVSLVLVLSSPSPPVSEGLILNKEEE